MKAQTECNETSFLIAKMQLFSLTSLKFACKVSANRGQNKTNVFVFYAEVQPNFAKVRVQR